MTISAGPTAPPGVILAGGQSRRMGGGDKGLLPFGAATVLAAVIARMQPQVGAFALNANGDPARFASCGLPVLPDGLPGQPGPLAGVLAAMDWALARQQRWVVTVACDTPFVPVDLVARLLASGTDAPIVIAASQARVHPTCGLWSTGLRGDLAATLARAARRLSDFTDRHGAAVVEFDPGPPDPFFNVNTPADLARARGWL